MREEKGKNYNLIILICEIILTISICLGITYNAYIGLAQQAQNYAEDLENDYTTLTNDYIRSFQVIKMEAEEQIKKDLSFDEMQEWMLSKDEEYCNAIGENVFDGFAFTYKGGYVHSWNYGDYSSYVPASRPWYQTAEKAAGKVAVVAPYVTFLSNTNLIKDYDILRMSIVQKYSDDISFDFDLNVSEINELLTHRNTLYQGTQSILYDKEGYILSSTDEEMYGHNVNTVDQQISDDLSKILTGYGDTDNQMHAHKLDGRLSLVYTYTDSEGKSLCMMIPFREVFYRHFLFVVFLAVILLAIETLFYVQNRRHLKRLIEANNSKTKFLSRMSHELRTPLNALTGYASIIKMNMESKEPNVAEQLENLNYIERAANYLLRVIEDILDVQTSKFGMIHIHKEIIDTDSYMKNIVETIQREAEEKGIHFIYERQTHVDRKYLIDGIRFQQILLNVLHNAVKFTPSGGTVTFIAKTLAYDAETTTVQFIIKDTGIGMSPEFVQKKLFTNFSQENESIDSPYEGCGIGLSITRQLLDLMGGTITCESEKGKGSVFTITITGERVKEESVKEESVKKESVKKESVKEKSERRTHHAYDLKGISVLLCEDNQMNQDMEKRILERMNCKVEIAEDGKIGLEMFQKNKEHYYDIILMDIRMPNMDGLEASRRIRSLDRADAKVIPILAVSANAFQDDVKASIDSGMNEHLAKPVGGRILYEKITEYCRGGDEVIGVNGSGETQNDSKKRSTGTKHHNEGRSKNE